MRPCAVFSLLLIITACSGAENIATTANQAEIRGPRIQPETSGGMYAPEQHERYDGRFRINGTKIYQTGTLHDASPWDHMDNDAHNLREVTGTLIIDVDEIQNTGTFRADLALPEGDFVVELERFHEFSTCQDGGIAAFLFEHGNAGCGDSNWPKSLLYVAGWGYGKATLNGQILYQDYEIHFMVTQGMRHRDSLKTILSPASGEAGSVNPAAQQLDFYIRSPERNPANHPGRAVFDHFFAMHVTWL
ncbi:MAG: hypothetical protein OSB45_14860 [Pseudomonadales bacterium]|jgi:hypothetical protein|nr:hypothetical protein [Pseudomonadales bacterium]